MRILLFSVLVIALGGRAAVACEGGVVAMIYQPAGGVFTAEVNGVPVADALEPGESFTGTRRLPPWLTPGENEVTVRVTTPSADGGVEVFLNCPGVDVGSPGENANSFGADTLAEAGVRRFTFEAPAGAVMDLPYSNAAHEGDAGLDEKIEALQAAFRAGDVPAIVADYGVMMEVAAAMGQPIGADQMAGMLSQVLPEAEVAYLDDYEIRSAMGGRLRIVTGPDRVTAPIVMKGKRFRMSAARIWSYIDGQWRLVAQ